ncbi:protein DOWNY MILDEW RESISTANCE 6 [Sesamum alatum]|uniref:Protein DOWNY MILDEW RESISTANCE 6 n=1 Tax=Sesamum alatum TaxID=300844 RepID=A0AAE1XVJ5_9LAMI|nr:protein DOWNY MILDEW RESISTANCE 6 [Sesamum alatum]
MRLSTSFNVKKETVHNWRDYLRLHCYPVWRNMHAEWPSNPSSFKLQEAISESLGLDKDNLKNVLGEQGQHMAMNYYPACPETRADVWITSTCTDPMPSPLLLQDMQSSLGFTTFSRMANGTEATGGSTKKRLASRCSNADKARLQWLRSSRPCDSANISAPKALTSGEDGVVYRDYTYAEYYKKFWSMTWTRKHCLNYSRTSTCSST